MKRRTWRRFTRKLRRWFDPVELGQTRGGLFLAAVIIAGWQLCAPVRAESSFGVSENDYFRLDWYYDLDAGWGTMGLMRICGWPYELILDDVSFVTGGAPFEWIKCDGNDAFGPPTLVGNQQGIPLYEYDALGPFSLVPSMSACRMFLRFDTENAALRETELRYQGYGLSAGGGLGVPFTSDPLPFVTIQTIPEPAAVATAALGAAALAALNRKRDEE